MQYLQHVEKFVDGMKVVEIPGRSDGPVFICMHGFGANAYDLAGLAQHLAFPEGTRFIFPDGILRIDLGYAAGREGRAWFPIDFEEIERIKREGGLRDLSKTLPAGMAEARDILIKAMKKLECDPAKTVVAGFSQGAMLATEIMLHHSEYLAGLLIFSGTLVNRTGWETMADAKFKVPQKPLKFFQSHGKHDPVLPYQAAERLSQLLLAHGGVGQLLGFEGQHEIPLEVITSANNWLTDIY
jgi:phospholipase/carboxylesterase